MTYREPNTLTATLIKRLARIDHLIGIIKVDGRSMDCLQAEATETIEQLALLRVKICSVCEQPYKSNDEYLCESCEREFHQHTQEIRS